MIHPELTPLAHVQRGKQEDFALKQEGYDPLYIHAQVEEQKQRMDPAKRHFLTTAAKAALVTTVLTEMPGIANFCEDMYVLGRILADPEVSKFVLAEDQYCKASETIFTMPPQKIQKRIIATAGDSVEYGVEGENNNTSDDTYEVNGMNINYNDTVKEHHPDLPQDVQWIPIKKAKGGTVIEQWEQQFDEIITAENQNHGEKISQTWKIGCGGNTLFYDAIANKERLTRIFKDPVGNIDDLIAFSHELNGTIEHAMESYKKELERIYSIKQQGFNIDGIVLIGVPDPTINDEVPVFDPSTQKSMTIDIGANENIRTYSRKAVKLMNNAIKQLADQFLQDHNDLSILYIHTPDLLTKEDMVGIHPNASGYWKIAREVMEHFKLQVVHSFKSSEENINLADLALPFNDPKRPRVQAHVNQYDRRGLLGLFAPTVKALFTG